MIVNLRGELNSFRANLINIAFDSLQPNGRDCVDIHELKQSYNP